MEEYKIELIIKLKRTNFNSVDKPPTINEFDEYLKTSLIIPENVMYFTEFNVLDNVEFIGNSTFTFRCTSLLKPKKLSQILLYQSFADGEWESPPGNGSFVYPTKSNPPNEYGVLSYSSVIINDVKYYFI